MARKIIVTNKLESSPEVHAYEFVFWLTVPTSRRSFYADPARTSVVVGIEAPTNPELTDLRNGTIKEEVYNSQWPVSYTLAQIQADLQTFYNERQAYITSYNPWVRYGSVWDGTTWTMKTIN